MNETDIVERAQDGDADAFGKLVLRHQAMVYGIAMSRLANPDLAEEAAQESFLLAWRKLPELRRPERFGPWLRVIARRTAGRARQRMHGQQAMDLQPEQLEAIFASSTSDPSHQAQVRDDLRTIRAILENLPARYREVVTMHDLLGWETAKVADDLGVSEEVVRQRLVRGRKQLRSGWEALLRSGQVAASPHATFASGIVSLIVAGVALGTGSIARAQAISAAMVGTGMACILVGFLIQWSGWLIFMGTMMGTAWIIWFRPRFYFNEEFQRRWSIICGLMSFLPFCFSAHHPAWVELLIPWIVGGVVLGMLPDLFPGSLRARRIYEAIAGVEAFGGAFSWPALCNHSRPMPTLWFLAPLSFLGIASLFWFGVGEFLLLNADTGNSRFYPGILLFGIIGTLAAAATISLTIRGIRRIRGSKSQISASTTGAPIPQRIRGVLAHLVRTKLHGYHPVSG